MSTKRKLLKAMQERLESQQRQIHMMADAIGLNKQAIIMIENKDEPKLKTLDQSVFDGQDEKWRFAAVDNGGVANYFETRPIPPSSSGLIWGNGTSDFKMIGQGYDASDWKNSLIERESKELIGSDLAKAYFKAGGKQHICYAGDDGDENTNDLNIELITHFCSIDGFVSSRFDTYSCALLIDSHGDELTAKEAGL